VITRTLTARSPIPVGIPTVSPRETGSPFRRVCWSARKQLSGHPQSSGVAALICAPFQDAGTTPESVGVLSARRQAFLPIADNRLPTPDKESPGDYAGSGSAELGPACDSPRRCAPSVASPARTERRSWTASRVTTVELRSMATTSHDFVPWWKKSRYSVPLSSVESVHVLTLLRAGFRRCGVIIITPEDPCQSGVEVCLSPYWDGGSSVSEVPAGGEFPTSAS
jgi:hypothetical protein